MDNHRTPVPQVRIDKMDPEVQRTLALVFTDPICCMPSQRMLYFGNDEIAEWFIEATPIGESHNDNGRNKSCLIITLTIGQ